jgi:hypothetical protein
VSGGAQDHDAERVQGCRPVFLRPLRGLVPGAPTASTGVGFARARGKHLFTRAKSALPCRAGVALSVVLCVGSRGGARKDKRGTRVQSDETAQVGWREHWQRKMPILPMGSLVGLVGCGC